MKTIDHFREEHRFLSNFWFMPKPLAYQDNTYPTVEHFFVAMKTQNLDQRREIASIEKPGDVKKAGRELTLRDDWEGIKRNVMRFGVERKFFDNPDLAEQLLATGNAILIEGNYWHDQTWGNCFCEKCANVDGENALGIILMNTRLTLIAERSS